MLDIEVVGAIVPKAKIVVYFAPNTDQGFLDAITTAVHDTINQPSVISISWGSAESNWTQQALTNFDDAFQSAAALGVSVTVASGDNGSSDGVNDGNDHVDFPASDPYVLGCGGTTLQASNDQIVNEVVWNNLSAGGGAGGGGVSDVFPLPTYQNGFNVPSPSGQAGGRGVPDVSGRCRSEHWLQRSRRWRERCLRRHQRGCASVCRIDHAHNQSTGKGGRFPQPADLRASRRSVRIPRHHQWQQRRLQRG